MKETVIRALNSAESASGVKTHECAELPVSRLVFSQELLDLCATNKCGNYNRSWTCPPAAGILEDQRRKIQSYENAFVFTTKHDLEDSFDFEGMEAGRENHICLTLEFRQLLGEGFSFYGAGSCPICKDANGISNCAFPRPCLHPEKKIGSIEAAGINVTELSKAAGLKYNNGPNTVTYFSMVLWE